MKDERVSVAIANKEITISNLDKVFWPREGYTKGDLINYYRLMASTIVPYLSGYPVVLHRYPDGIEGDGFYQKECPAHAPDWLRRVALPSGSSRLINYCICEDTASLLWIVNQGSIEIHQVLAPYQKINYPSVLVIDLDPSPPAHFSDCLEVAMLFRDALAYYHLKGFPKTSGGAGLHIYVPIHNLYSYEEVRRMGYHLSKIVQSAYPEKCTLTRSKEKRKGVYLDYLQNGKGKTMAAVYSVRPRPGAPVSTPLTWEEIADGRVSPNRLNMFTIPEHIQQAGDLFKEVLTCPQDPRGLLEAAVEKSNR